jgi:hypothetical protein
MKNEKENLAETISLLKIKQAQDLILMKEQLHTTFESLKPINLIKNTFHEIEDSPEIKNGLLNSAVGYATDFISKKVMVNAADNSMKKIIGSVLQFAITNLVAKNADTIVTTGENLLKRVLKSKNGINQQFSANGNGQH